MQKISLYGIDKKIAPIFHPAMRFHGRYKLLYGGRAGMKSYYTCQELIYRVFKERNHNILCVRMVEADCKESQYEQLKQVIEDLGVSEFFTFKKKPLEIESKVFNSRFIFRGLSDAKRLKGLANVTSCWVEETAEIENFDDFLYLDATIRGSDSDKDYYVANINGVEQKRKRFRQLYLTFNPTSEKHWLYKRWFSGEPDPDAFILKTTYRDNPFLDQDTIRSYDRVRLVDPMKYNVQYLGNWGILSKDSLFYPQFNVEKHTINTNGHGTTFNRNLVTHVSFDFNAVPYISAGIFQVNEETKKIFMVKEFANKAPRNNTKALAEDVVLYLKRCGYTKHILLYGDPSGKQRNTTHERGFNQFQIIEEVFKEANFIFDNRVQSKAESLELRRDFMNEFFEKGMNGYELLIYENCEKMIIDITNQKIKQTTSGFVKNKERRRDPDTGDTVETRAHFNDLLDYFITSFFQDIVSRYGKGGSTLQHLRSVKPAARKMY